MRTVRGGVGRQAGGPGHALQLWRAYEGSVSSLRLAPLCASHGIHMNGGRRSVVMTARPPCRHRTARAGCARAAIVAGQGQRPDPGVPHARSRLRGGAGGGRRAAGARRGRAAGGGPARHLPPRRGPPPRCAARPAAEQPQRVLASVRPSASCARWRAVDEPWLQRCSTWRWRCASGGSCVGWPRPTGTTTRTPAPSAGARRAARRMQYAGPRPRGHAHRHSFI